MQAVRADEASVTIAVQIGGAEIAVRRGIDAQLLWSGIEASGGSVARSHLASPDRRSAANRTIPSTSPASRRAVTDLFPGAALKVSGEHADRRSTAALSTPEKP
jgi:hypothetical protein